jgi:hypothetical protein
MPLTENDLVKWFDDPEVWSLEEGKDNDAWEYEIRVNAPTIVSYLSLTRLCPFESRAAREC